MKKLIEILNDIRADIDFEKEKQLVDQGILDSMDIMMIVAEITDAYDIVISPADIVPSNFNSADAIGHMIEKLK